MNHIAKHTRTAGLFFCVTAAMLAQTPGSTVAKVRTKPEKKAAAVHADPAERVFQANCNRCHAAPEGLSTRVTGTVVRHMRVRANLSADEERMILDYLNP